MYGQSLSMQQRHGNAMQPQTAHIRVPAPFSRNDLDLLLVPAVTQAEIEGLYKRFRQLDRGRKVTEIATLAVLVVIRLITFSCLP